MFGCDMIVILKPNLAVPVLMWILVIVNLKIQGVGTTFLFLAQIVKQELTITCI